MRGAVLFVLLLLAACDDTEPAPPPVLAPVRAEVVNASPALPPREAMLRERAGEVRVLSDARDAWVLRVGESVRLAVPRLGTDRFASAGAIVRTDGAPSEGRVRLTWSYLDVPNVPSGSHVSTTQEIDLADPALAWNGFVILGKDPGATMRIELSSAWIGTPPPGAEHVHAAFEVVRGARGRPSPPANAPNVLIVTVDTLRADRLGCAGYARATTPRIDALAAGGTRFASAYSSAPWTLPSYGSLFTGLLPGQHRAGVVTERDALFALDRDAPRKTTTELLRADVATLAERFEAAGWSTAMFHNNPYLSRASGIERGFQRYVRYESNARNGVDLALRWIEDAGDAPWFLVVHLMDPHFPYAPPAPYDEQFAGRAVDAIAEWPPDLARMRAGRPADEIARLCSDLYDGEIAYTDAQIGRLLDALAERGRIANTIVALHSDHGEEFWEHGSADHGHAQHEELLRVPLVLSAPGRVPAGRVVASRVRALDLFATLLDLAGLAVPEGVESRSLRPLLAGEEPPRSAFAEAVHRGAREIKAVLEGPRKLVVRGLDARLHDLTLDPGETRDLAASEAAHVEALRGLLLAHHGRSREAAKQARALEFDAATRGAIENLGYGGHDEPPPAPR
jgi:arylsulfatase A-like enzyme